MKIAIYARVSTDKQETENQLLQLREFASKQDWQIFLEYVDYESGSKSDRAAFKQMFEDAGKRRFDLVLFWSLDRFTREGVLETLQHLQRLTGNGIDWWSFKEEYLRSIGPFRDAVLSILATIAKQERVRLSERVKAGLDRARAQGKAVGRPKVVVDRAKVLELHQRGFSQWDISQELGVSRASVGRIIAERTART